MTLWRLDHKDGRTMFVDAGKDLDATGRAMTVWKGSHLAHIYLRHARKEDLDEAEQRGIPLPDDAEKKLYRYRTKNREIILTVRQKNFLAQDFCPDGGLEIEGPLDLKFATRLSDDALGAIKDSRMYLTDMGHKVRELVLAQPRPFKADKRRRWQ